MTPAPVVRLMRLLAAGLLLLAPLLAGCTAPTEDKPDPLFGLCPQWMQGPGNLTDGVHAAANQTDELTLEGGNSTYLGKPLDLYRVHLDRLVVEGRAEMRAFSADGQQRSIRDYRQETPQLVPVVVFTDDTAAGHEFDVFLSPVTQDGPASPAPVTLKWTATGDVVADMTVTFHYKVCGS